MSEMRAEEIAVGVMIETQGRVWAVHPDYLPTLRGLHGVTIKHEVVEAADNEARARAPKGPQPNAQGVATVPLQGIITPKASILDMLFGDSSGGLQMFRAQMRQALANPDIGSIVLNVDSPGGLTDMVSEVAAEIRQARDSGKPIVAVCNTLCASAAYWLASQAHEVVVTPSAIVGSVGVYNMHQDISGAADKAGVKVSLISAGAYKVEGNPYQPLEGDAQATMQKMVDDFYGMFVSDVAQGRGVEVPPEDIANGTAFGGGRTFTAKDAVKIGLADRVATIDQTIARLSSGRSKVRRMGANNEFLEGDRDGEAELLGEATQAKAVEYTPEERDRLLTTLAGLR